MKFAHLSDTHLGYRQYGLIEREDDFYNVFNEIVDKIIDERVDFVIHSGDLFEIAKPSPNALLIFQEGLMKIKESGIPFLLLLGIMTLYYVKMLFHHKSFLKSLSYSY